MQVVVSRIFAEVNKCENKWNKCEAGEQVVSEQSLEVKRTVSSDAGCYRRSKQSVRKQVNKSKWTSLQVYRSVQVVVRGRYLQVEQVWNKK
jgi:hypothetical protein